MIKKFLCILLCAVLFAVFTCGCSNSEQALLKDNNVLFTIDGEYEVTRDLFLYYLLGYRSNVDGGEEGYWDTREEEGKQLVAYVINNFRYQYAMLKWAKDLGLEQTQSDLDSVSAYMAQLEQSYGSAEALNAVLHQGYATREVYQQLMAEESVVKRLSSRLYAADSEYAIHTQQELEDYKQNGDPLFKAKHILILNEKDDDKEDNLAQMQQLLQQLWEGADFDTLMNAYSEDTGLAANPDGYLFGEGEMVAIFENTVKELGFGEISGVVESTYGYHIILKLEPTLEEYSSALTEKKLNDKLTEYVLALETEYTDGFESLKVSDFIWPYKD